MSDDAQTIREALEWQRTLGAPSWTTAGKSVADALAELDRLLAENERLRAVLREARPYVYGVARGFPADHWRGQTDAEILTRVDAALAARSDPETHGG